MRLWGMSYLSGKMHQPEAITPINHVQSTFQRKKPRVVKYSDLPRTETNPIVREHILRLGVCSLLQVQHSSMHGEKISSVVHSVHI
jgi:hypothetical protein